MSEDACPQVAQCEEAACNQQCQNKEETDTIRQPVQRMLIISTRPVACNTRNSTGKNANSNMQQATNDGNKFIQTRTQRRTIRKGTIKVSGGTRRTFTGTDPMSMTSSVLAGLRQLTPPSTQGPVGSVAKHETTSQTPVSNYGESGTLTIVHSHLLATPERCAKRKTCRQVPHRRKLPAISLISHPCCAAGKRRVRAKKKRCPPTPKKSVCTIGTQTKTKIPSHTFVTCPIKPMSRVDTGCAKPKPCEKKANRACVPRRRSCTMPASPICPPKQMSKDDTCCNMTGNNVINTGCILAIPSSCAKPKPCRKKAFRACLTRRVPAMQNVCKKITSPRVKCNIITSNQWPHCAVSTPGNCRTKLPSMSSCSIKPKVCENKTAICEPLKPCAKPRTCSPKSLSSNVARQDICPKSQQCKKIPIISNRSCSSKMQKKIAEISTEAKTQVCAAAEREKEMLTREKLAEEKRCIDEAARAAKQRHEKKINELCSEKEEIMEKEREEMLRNLAEAKICIIESKFRENLKYVDDKAELEQKDIEAEARRELAEIELAESMAKAYETDCAKRCK